MPTMKHIMSILFIILQFAGLFAAAVSNNAAEKCGSLGVMSAKGLSESTISAGVRPCADHPLGHRRTGVQSLAPMSKAEIVSSMLYVEPDACYYAAPYGCSGGYCWTSCGDRGSGKWCWLAANRGMGAWLKCTTQDQCDRNAAANSYCGVNCKAGSKACGCSCDH